MTKPGDMVIKLSICNMLHDENSQEDEMLARKEAATTQASVAI